MSRFASLPNREAFHRQVWDLVRRIPEGKVITYGQIAEMLPPPDGVEMPTYRAFGARWVGGAMANCPEDVPWQRVVNAQGKISIRQSGYHLLQKQLLVVEGVSFDEHDRIDLQQFGWLK